MVKTSVASPTGPHSVADSLMTACPVADSPAVASPVAPNPVAPKPQVPKPGVPGPETPGPEVPSPEAPSPGPATPGADSLVGDVPGDDDPGAPSPGPDRPGPGCPSADSPAQDQPAASALEAAGTAAPPARLTSPARSRWRGRAFRAARLTGLGRSARLAQPVDMEAAAEFIRLHRREAPDAGPVEPRLREIRREIRLTGTYRHTVEELEFGARVAWRNSSRCIGRLYWKSLKVRDRREVDTAAGVAEECAAHLRAATNHGRVRPIITVFAPDTPARSGPRIWNEQLVRYAGYQQPDGSVRGEPSSSELTGLARGLGWDTDGQGRFDVLPLIISAAGEGAQVFGLPPDAVAEVHLIHPRFSWFGELGLRWYAVPVICDMCLEIGGICYPAAPFNGWYMGTEIGARNLADPGRYDQLPAIAARMGLDTTRDRSLWRDLALVELNLAVLHSFETAGVTITDHHTESRRFLTHLAREERAGRVCPADWTWIVPPISGSATEVFHRYYAEAELHPAYARHHRKLPGVPAAPDGETCS
ncbi:MAG: nitric-oxide synthase, bacterial [Streptosporangiaceae bacterium]|nr:nitric-oxide synthase, bacterial [Streptosporangiaceae bacterium]